MRIRQRLTGAWGGLERDLVLAGRLRERFDVLQRQFVLLGGLAFLLQQQRVARVRIGDDPGWLIAEFRGEDRCVAQPQRHRMPAGRQDFEFQFGGHVHHLVSDGGFALDVGQQRGHGWLQVGLGQFGLAGLLPERLELLVRQEHPPARLLENLPQLGEGHVNRLFAERLLRCRVRFAGRWLSQPAHGRSQHQGARGPQVCQSHVRFLAEERRRVGAAHRVGSGDGSKDETLPPIVLYPRRDLCNGFVNRGLTRTRPPRLLSWFRNTIAGGSCVLIFQDGCRTMAGAGCVRGPASGGALAP